MLPKKKEIATVFRVLGRVFGQGVAKILRKHLLSFVSKICHVFRICATSTMGIK